MKYKHQNKILEQIQDKNRCALFLEMRLGKTYLAYEWMQGRPLPCLIVAPKMTHGGWLKLINNDKNKDKIKIINKENNQLKQELLKAKTIILDESHTIKNPKTKIYKTLMKNTNHEADNRLILSGTPKDNSELELIPQLLWCFGSLLGQDNYWDFRYKYCRPKDIMGYEWELNPAARTAVYNFLDKNSIFLSQKDVDNFNNQSPIYETIVETLSSEDSRTPLIQTLRRDWELDAAHQAKQKMTILIWEQQLASGFKENECFNEKRLKTLHSYIDQTNCPTVIFYRFTSQGIAIQQEFKHSRVCRLINGKTPQADRLRYIQKFQSGRCSLLIIQTTLGRFGLDLSAAEQAIFFSNSFSMIDRIQCEKRLTNLERKTRPKILDIYAKDTVEEDLYNLLKQKKFSLNLLYHKFKKRI